MSPPAISAMATQHGDTSHTTYKRTTRPIMALQRDATWGEEQMQFSPFSNVFQEVAAAAAFHKYRT